MQDNVYHASINQRASGTIIVLDYTLLALKTITVGSDTLTEGTDFNASTDNATTATAIAAAIDALTGVSATASGDTVTIYADASGTSGNSKALTTNAVAGAATLSAATLTGGVAASYTDAVQVKGESATMFTSLTLTGSSPTCDITPQISADKSTWYDAKDTAGNAITFTQLTSSGGAFKYLPITGLWVRAKVVNGGTNTVVTGTIIVTSSGS